MKGISLALTDGQIRVKLFLRAATISVVQAGGVVLASKLSKWGLVTAFLISWLWIGNTRDSVDHRPSWSRFAYGLGGMAGYGIVLLVAYAVWRMHLL